MGDFDLQMEVKENKANIQMLSNKLNALIEILKKEGVTTQEEVEAIVKEMMEKKDE